MSFSRLLLVAANSKKCILGVGNDKVCISPKILIGGRDAYEGEVILCFQLDDRTDQEKRVPRSLGILGNSPRCDGLIFYAQDGETGRVICLVEMKSTNVALTVRNKYQILYGKLACIIMALLQVGLQIFRRN